MSKKPEKKFIYVSAFKVTRKPAKPGPDARVTNHGTVLGCIRVPAGNSRKNNRARAELYSRFEGVIRGNGRIYKNPDAVALWVYSTSSPPENWRGDDVE